MSDLPDGWEWTTLGEIAEVRLGRQRSPKNHSGTHMRPYVRAANVAWDGLKLDDVKQMNFTDEETEVYRLQPGDILLSEASGSASEVGKPAIWNGEIENCCFQNTLVRVRPFRVKSKFLFLFLKFEAFRGAFVRHSRGVGIHHIGVARLANWPVPLPPLAEQRRIVVALEEHLSRLDAGLTSMRRVESKLSSWLASARQHAVFHGASESNLPDGWQLLPLGDLLDRVEAGKSFAAEGRSARHGEWGIIKVSAMTSGIFKASENKAISDYRRVDKRYEIRAGDLLLSRANTKEYVGSPVLVPEHEEQLLLSDKSLRLIPAPGIPRDWLVAALSSPFVRHQISSRATGTKDSMRNIAQKSLLEVKVPVPPAEFREAVAMRSAECVAGYTRISRAVNTGKSHAEQLRRGLLREAFEGRLIAQDSRDEPASVLIGRIQDERGAASSGRREKKAGFAHKAGGTSAAAKRVIDPARPLPESIGRGTQDALELDF